MAYTKSAVKLQNFPDIAISFWGKFTYKPLFVTTQHPPEKQISKSTI